MNKEEFMREIEKVLDNISEAERADILYDYEEHFMIGKENGKTEEEICLELGSPKEIANNYMLNHINESVQYGTKGDIKKERAKNNPLFSRYNRRKVILGSGVIITVLLLFVAGFGEIARHNNSNIFIKGNKVEPGGIRIDSSGIHGGGISIDSDGVKAPGVSVDSNGVKVPSVDIDSNGVKVPGVIIDNNGVKVPGVSIDDKGVKIDLPDVKINIEN